MRKVLRVAAIAAVGLALLSCARRAEEQAAPPPPAAYDQSGAPDGGAGYDDGRGQSLGGALWPVRLCRRRGSASAASPYDRSTYDAAQPAPPASPYGRPNYALSRPSPPLALWPVELQTGRAAAVLRPAVLCPAPQVITPPVYGRTPPAPYGRPAYAEAAPPPQPPNGMVWRSSPRWATTKKPTDGRRRGPRHRRAPARRLAPSRSRIRKRSSRRPRPRRRRLASRT